MVRTSELIREAELGRRAEALLESLAAVVSARRERLLSFCLVWLLLHLAIESSVLGLHLVFEHRMYLPSVGVFVGVSALLFRFVSEGRAVAAGDGSASTVPVTMLGRRRMSPTATTRRSSTTEARASKNVRV